MKASNINTSIHKPQFHVHAQSVLDELKKYMQVDGFDFVLDLENSSSPYFSDLRTGRKYNDFFTCFASMPIGMNHPKMLGVDFLNRLVIAAVNKPSNSDIYTEELATFVKTFFKLAVPPAFKYSFFISGGALAVENALKAAFDWKVKKNFRKGHTSEKGHQIIHFLQAFHGRSGYTMSMTNTDPAKTNLYPKFQWPRITNPKITFPMNEENLEKVIGLEEMSIEEIKAAFSANKDDIAAIIIEPIQGEGGDNHFRPEFLKMLRNLADENDALLIYDEIQTGVGITGTMWAHEQLGATPDIMAFGKKMQTCGIIVTDRIDEVSDNVFHVSSRINSTWGGSLVDMVRSTRYLEIIHEENMLENVRTRGKELLDKLHNLAQEFPTLISNIRGRGLFCAFDLPNKEIRNNIQKKCFDEGLLILPSGDKSIRFRPPLNMTRQALDEGFGIIERVLRICWLSKQKID